jgi:hypothetical protein
MYENAIHWTIRMVVILFWNLELSPTYSNDFFISIKELGISSTIKAGFLYFFVVMTSYFYWSNYDIDSN